MEAKKVFAHSIKFLGEEAVNLIRQETGDDDFKVEDIQWVLTVPAIWTPRAKQFMREAAYEVRLIQDIRNRLLSELLSVARADVKLDNSASHSLYISID